ncbi:fork head domain-containing protein, partial [Flagelloscypha sp. PMI_526]
ESLRRDLGLPPEMPLSLNSIQDPGPDYRPVFSYMLLVQVALLESPMQKLTLQGIYEALEARFAWCRGNSTWKESIRHMLTLRAEFEHISREEAACFPGKGSFW